jgi:hypothetical protein
MESTRWRQGGPIVVAPKFRGAFDMGKLSAVFVLISITLLPLQSCRGGNPVYDELMRRGVPISAREVVRLPAPTLADGLTAEQQRHAVEGIADGTHTWEELTRRSVVAPFVFKMPKETDQGGPGRRVDLWFVAYGNMSTLENNEWLERQFRTTGSETDPDNGAVVKVLTEGDLARHGLKLGQSADEPQYVFAELTLLDRVRLSVTTRGAKLQSPESVTTASLLDPRFANDSQYANRWRPVLRDDNNRRYLGKPEPYFGYGSYAKATRLLDPPGAILIEYHAAFAEPEGWFNGNNFLCSKLPILAQMIVRQLRRELAKSH